MFTITYDFLPGDAVYVVDIEDCAVYQGTVCQFEGDIYPDENDNNVERKLYLVLLDGDQGTTEVEHDKVFATLEEALMALSGKFTPTPSPTESVTPTPSTSLTPTPTPTESVSVTPTPTVSVTASITPTTTPSVTSSVSPTPTITPTPSSEAFLPDIFFPLDDPDTNPLFIDNVGNTFGYLRALNPHDASKQTYQVVGPNGGNNALGLNGASLIYPFSNTMLKNYTAGEISAFCWVKTSSTSSQTFVDLFPASTLPTATDIGAFRLATNNPGVLAVLSIDTDDNFIFISGPNIADDAWHHVGFTSDGFNTTLYLDGAPVGTNTSTAPVKIPNETIGFIGSRSDDVTGFTGSIKDVKIWGYNLPQSFVVNEYNNGL